MADVSHYQIASGAVRFRVRYSSAGKRKQKSGFTTYIDAALFGVDAGLDETAVILAGVQLTQAQKDELVKRLNRLDTQVGLLRASTFGGSIDDELDAILDDG
jgi:hypothetical protein